MQNNNSNTTNRKSLPLPSHKGWGIILIPLAIGLVSFLGVSLNRPEGILSHIFLYLLVVMAAAMWWGSWLAAYAFVLALAAIDYFFVPPRGSFLAKQTDYSYTSEVLGLIFFLVLAVFTIYLISALRRERDRAHTLALLEREAKEEVIKTAQELERQHQRTLYLQHARQLLSSTLDPQAVLQKILDELVETIGGKVVLILDNKEARDIWQAGTLSNDDEQQQLDEGADSLLLLRAGGRLLGRLAYSFDSSSNDKYDKQSQKKPKLAAQEPILTTLAALSEYIAISLENGKLYQTLEFQNNEIAQLLRTSLGTDSALSKQADQLAIFYRLSAAIISGISKPDLMALGLSEAARVLTCTVCFVLSYSASKEELKLVAQRGELNLSEGYTFKLKDTLPGWVIQNRKPFLSNDFDDVSSQGKIYPVLTNSLKPIRSCLYVPIVSDDEIYGLIAVGSIKYNQYTAEDTNFLVGLASLLTIAQLSYQYYQEREYAASIEERNRIARDLHDGLAQSINYIGLKAQLIKELDEAGETKQIKEEIERIAKAAELARTDVREVLYGLRHTEHDLNLPQALADLVHKAAELSGIKITMRESDEASSNDWPELALDVQIQLLRIVQEALSNLQKHSKATEAQVSAFYTNAQPKSFIRLEIKDNGIGFEPKQMRSKGSQQLGLGIMRERAKRIGASLEIESQVGLGTKVIIEYLIISRKNHTTAHLHLPPPYHKEISYYAK